MDLDSDLGWTNPAANGVRKRYGWNDFQTKLSDQINWSKMDADIANAAKTGKRIGISVVMCAYEKPKPQTWPTDLNPTAIFDITAPLSGKVRTEILAWDPPVLKAILDFTKALCLHVDGKVDYIAMGGLGSVIESIWAENPTELGMTEADALAAWTASSTAIVEAYAANLTSTPFIFTADFPFTGAASKTALTNLIEGSDGKGGFCARWPGRFGIMNCGLSENSNVGYIPFRLVHDHSATNPTGLQYVASSAGLPGHPPVDIKGAMDAAVTLLAHFVEVYPLDLNDSANAIMFESYQLKLAP